MAHRPDEGSAGSRQLRFAFYGRMSTVEFQDRTSSGRQREVAEETIRGHGVIVAEYFDEGCSRRQPWRQRPAAAQLMAAAEHPNRTFDGVVIGEYERVVRPGSGAGLVVCHRARAGSKG
jgi:DNA invertase Pin-like site-specific DNA recombinase